MKPSMLTFSLLFLCAPALAETTAAEPADSREQLVELLKARDAQAQRYEDSRSVPTLLDIISSTFTTTSVLATGLMLGGALARDSVGGNVALVGGCVLATCSFAGWGGAQIAQIVVDKREVERVKLEEAQRRLDEAIMPY